MKILLLNYTDAGGGAAIAALRLVTALNNHGIYARMGVVVKETSNPYVFELPKRKKNIFVKILRKIKNYLHRIFEPFTRHLPKIETFTTTNEILHSKNFVTNTDIKWINNSDYDLVNLHWIINTVGIKEIAKIKKSLVWTMHDTWPYCGAEHYPNVLENDNRYKYDYTKENKPVTTKGQDLCRKVWQMKKKYLADKNIIFVSPSNWECQGLKESSLFKDKQCYVIPNVIPSDSYRKLNKVEIKKAFGFPEDKIILGFGAAYGINNPKSVKGTYYLLDALKKIKNTDSYFMVIFGDAREEFTSQVPINFFSAGFISNTKILSLLYNACDIFICPSLVENLPNTCLESIFCGVPVVAFNSGGTKDIVVHKETGYLATPYNTDEIIDGVEWCSNNLAALSDNCLSKAKSDFDETNIINEYKRIYELATNS